MLCICSSNYDTSFHILVQFFGKYKTTKTILHQSSQTTENKLIYVKYSQMHKGSSVVKVHGSLTCLPFSYSIHVYSTHTHTQCPVNKHVFLNFLISNAGIY